MNDQASGNRFNTLAIHAGQRSPHADHAMIALGDNLDLGGADAVSLARRLLDTSADGQSTNGSAHAVLEERVAALDGGSAAFAVASGRMARLIAFRTLMQPGDEIVASRQFSSGKETFNRSLASFGWQVTSADPEKPESFVEALSDKTKAILVESISEHGAITDIEAIARVAQRARVPLIVDNSFATPVLVRPIEHGADVVIYSEPRLLCGVASGVGLIVDGGTFDWTNDVRYPALAGPARDGHGLILSEAFGNFAFTIACRLFARRDFGDAVLAPTAPWLLLGIETLPLRMQRHCDNALAIARHLERHPAISRVRYAGLPGDRGSPLAQRLCPEGSGAALSFQLAGGRQAEAQFLDRLRLLSTDADNVEIGGTRSTVAAFRDGDGSSAVRVSAGLEDKDDIIADLDQAMAG